MRARRQIPFEEVRTSDEGDAQVGFERFQSLRTALGDEKANRWFELKTEDSEVALDLAQIVYVRLDTEEHRVGF